MTPTMSVMASRASSSVHVGLDWDVKDLRRQDCGAGPGVVPEDLVLGCVGEDATDRHLHRQVS